MRRLSRSNRLAALAAFCLALSGGTSSGMAQTACPANAHVVSTDVNGNVTTVHCGCNAGYQNVGGACQPVAASPQKPASQPIGGDPQCIKQAGEALKNDQQQGCAVTVGQCFTDNKSPLSASALACLVACRQVATCAIGCGISALASASVVEKCVDVLNSCFDAALARNRVAVAACKTH
jgi:hypothetical protein